MPTPQETLKNAADACRNTLTLMKILNDGTLQPMKADLKNYEDAKKEVEDANLKLKKWQHMVVTQKSSLPGTLKAFDEQTNLLNSLFSTLSKDSTPYIGPLKQLLDRAKADLVKTVKVVEATRKLFNEHLKTVNSVPPLK